jgi:succinate dehydrogenase / fumarate reductase cytochrome b subunit
MMQKSAKRPVYLNLFQIQQPIGAVVSIVHRVTGALLALLTPFGLWALHLSLQGPAGYARVQAVLGSVPGRLLALLALWLLLQHLYSGIRHLLLDVNVGFELPTARASAWATFAASVITVVLVALLW